MLLCSILKVLVEMTSAPGLSHSRLYSGHSPSLHETASVMMSASLSASSISLHRTIFFT